MVSVKGMCLLYTALAILVLSVMILGVILRQRFFAGSLDLTLGRDAESHFLGMCQINLPWIILIVLEMKTPFNSVTMRLRTTVTSMRVQAWFVHKISNIILANKNSFENSLFLFKPFNKMRLSCLKLRRSYRLAEPALLSKKLWPFTFKKTLNKICHSICNKLRSSSNLKIVIIFLYLKIKVIFYLHKIEVVFHFAKKLRLFPF
jgi:hypothetical protein